MIDTDGGKFICGVLLCFLRAQDLYFELISRFLFLLRSRFDTGNLVLELEDGGWSRVGGGERKVEMEDSLRFSFMNLGY